MVSTLLRSFFISSTRFQGLRYAPALAISARPFGPLSLSYVVPRKIMQRRLERIFVVPEGA